MEETFVESALVQLQRLFCQQQVRTNLFSILGPENEGEDYMKLSDAIICRFEKCVSDSESETECVAAFCRSVNDDASDAEEAEWVISRKACEVLFDLIWGCHFVNFRSCVQEGAQHLIDSKPNSTATSANVAEKSTSNQGALAFTPEDKYSLMLLAQQSRGSIDEASLITLSMETTGQHEAEVELNQQTPRFLRDHHTSLPLSFAPKSISASAGPQKSWLPFKHQAGSIYAPAQDSAQLSLGDIAKRQDNLGKERREIRKRVKQQRRNTIAEGEELVPTLHRELDEAPEERGIRSQTDIPTQVPPWMKSTFEGGMISFGPKRDSSIQQQRQSLPITKHKREIVSYIQQHPTTVLVGEAGSGKTTQIPQYLAEEGFAAHGIVGCTQPRRVAAISVAERVAEEYGCALGDDVGYSVRFRDKTSKLTIIKYMTDGMLLREALLDPAFERYSVIILDEAHERSVNTDVLFGMVKAAQRMRPSLKIVVTSATLDVDRFCAFFGTTAPVRIEGRTFPVDVLHFEPAEDYVSRAINLVMEIHLQEGPGDILLFLTGQDEIETAAERLFKYMQQLPDAPRLIILPIYSALPAEIQSKVFEKAPPLSRKVVLATNIAETSITISDLYYVIDPGFCKLKMYDPTTGIEQLKIVPISQQQATQRKGRAGRTGPGRCYRLYTKEQLETQMMPATEPEIRRCNLANVVLVLKAVGVGDLFKFEFMDPPSQDALVSAMEKLFYLGALDQDGLLTPVGRRMSALPVDPPLSKTLLCAVDMGCVSGVLTAVSMLMAPHIFYRPREKEEEADRKHAIFQHPEGDQITLVAVYDAWIAEKRSEQWCRDHFVNFRGLNDAQEARAQLLSILSKSGASVEDANAPTKDFAQIRKALTAGFFFQVAKRTAQGSYVTLGDRRTVFIHPSSALFHVQPRYVVYHELVLTSREYMRQVMAIDSAWLCELAPDRYSTPGEGRLTKEQAAQRLDPTLRPWERGSDWRISRLRRRRH